MAACMLALITWLLLPLQTPVAQPVQKSVFEITIKTPSEAYFGSLTANHLENELIFSTRIYNTKNKTHLVSKSVFAPLKDNINKRGLTSISSTHLPNKSTFYFKRSVNELDQETFELEAQWHSLELLKKSYPPQKYCSVFVYAYKIATLDPSIDCPQRGLIFFNQQRLLGFYEQLAQDVNKISVKAIKSPANSQQSVIVWSDPNGYTGIGAGSTKMTLRRITTVGSIK